MCGPVSLECPHLVSISHTYKWIPHLPSHLKPRSVSITTRRARTVTYHWGMGGGRGEERVSRGSGITGMDRWHGMAVPRDEKTGLIPCGWKVEGVMIREILGKLESELAGGGVGWEGLWGGGGERVCGLEPWRGGGGDHLCTVFNMLMPHMSAWRAMWLPSVTLPLQIAHAQGVVCRTAGRGPRLQMAGRDVGGNNMRAGGWREATFVRDRAHWPLPRIVSCLWHN